MKTDNRTSLLLMVTGLALIFIGHTLNTPTKASVLEIDKNLVGDRVQITGALTAVNPTDKAVFFSLQERPDLTIVSFTPKTDIKKGDEVTITGRVDLYEGRVEVIAEKIRAHRP